MRHHLNFSLSRTASDEFDMFFWNHKHKSSPLRFMWRFFQAAIEHDEAVKQLSESLKNVSKSSTDLGSITSRCSRKSTGSLKTLSSSTTSLTRETTLTLLEDKKTPNQQEEQEMAEITVM